MFVVELQAECVFVVELQGECVCLSLSYRVSVCVCC